MAKVAVVQMVSSAHVKENLLSLDPLFLQAKEKGVELLVLPENFAFMGVKEEDKLKIAEKYGQGAIQEAVSDLAKRYGIWVVAGTIPLQFSPDRINASCIVYDAKGVPVARYDKIHLFDVRVSEQEMHQESNTIARGDKPVVVDTPVGRLGLSICYDLRFPELYHQLMLKGAEIFVIPSAFTAATGVAHWEVLLRARAIENLCYVLAPNQGGLHANGRSTYGHSMIIEPWGRIMSEQKKGSGVIIADVDLIRLTQLRQQFPCNNHHVLTV